jgi:probable phosphoglycerate mutase
MPYDAGVPAPRQSMLLLVRHGGTTAGADHFAGSIDVPLSDDGRAQAAALGRRLSEVRIDVAYSSPLQRAIQTANAIAAAHGLMPQPVPDLREIAHGHWEGRSISDVKTCFADEYAAYEREPLTFAPPGGEPGAAVLARALPALRQIVARHPGQTVLAISHKATIRLALCGLLGIDPRLYRARLQVDLASLNVLRFSDPHEAQLVRFNDTSHYTTAIA